MTTITLSCDDCGRHIETARANTKYCAICRLIRDLPFTFSRKYECGLCAETYAPLHIRDPLCGEHAPPSNRTGEHECAFCGVLRPRIRADINVCDQCARDPELRQRFYAALVRKQREQKERTI